MAETASRRRWAPTVVGIACQACGDTAKYENCGSCVTCKLDYTRSYRAKNRDRIDTNTSAWWANNKARLVEVDRNRRADPIKRALRMWHKAKTRALAKDLDFSLTVGWVEERTVAGVCELTGMPFEFYSDSNEQNPYAPSIDRIDSSKGYTPENCRVILWAVNTALCHWGLEIFLPIAQKLISKENK